jgi:hypothetical protein
MVQAVDHLKSMGREFQAQGDLLFLNDTQEGPVTPAQNLRIEILGNVREVEVPVKNGVKVQFAHQD